MKVNKNKVIILPKEFKTDGYDFICPCPICTEKEHQDRARYMNMQEVKNTIEDILDSTSLRAQEFHIDISYTGSEHEKRIYSDKQVNNVPELVKIIALAKHLIKLSTQFDAKYRHPLMCEMREELRGMAINTGIYSSNYSDQRISKTRLVDLELLISNVDTLAEICNEIKKDEILEAVKIDSAMQKLKDTRRELGRQLRVLFLEGLESQGALDTSDQEGALQNIDLKYEI